MQKYTKKFKEIKKISIRSLLRSGALSILYFLHIAKIRAALRKNRVHFIYLHHVFNDEINKFKLFIDYLIDSGHIFVGYSEAIKIIKSGEIGHPYICLSFDDGLKSCMNAESVLSERRISAMFFINGLVLEHNSFFSKKNFARKRLNMQPVDFLNYENIKHLKLNGHEIGNHTYSHQDISKITQHEFEADFLRNHRLLTEAFGEIKHFAWGYGGTKNVTNEALSFVENFGYLSSASAERGCYISKDAGLYVLRDHCIAHWPIAHMKYLMYRSIKNAE